LAKTVKNNGDIAIKIHISAFKTSNYLPLKGVEKCPVALGTVQAFQEAAFELFRLCQRQAGSQKAFFSAGKAEIAPFGPENGISYRFLHFQSYLVLEYYEILCNDPNSLTQGANLVKYISFYKKRLIKEAKTRKPKRMTAKAFSFGLFVLSF
jgi:hypothetical protein